MKDKNFINTKLGKLTFETDNDSAYPGVFLKLNGVPLLLLEQNEVNGEDKIVIKNYHNENSVIDDDYMNLDRFDIDMDNIENIREQVLSDIGEELA